MLQKIMISGDKEQILLTNEAIFCPVIFYDCPNKVKEEQSSHVKITLFTQDIHKCYIEKS